MRNEEWCRLRRHMWKKGCTHEACKLGFGAVPGAACVAAHGAITGKRCGVAAFLVS